MFSQIIKKFRQDNHLSQNEFIALLSKHHDSFKSLDVVTLSRWERQVTTPHLTRQNELLTLIGVNLLDVRSSSDLTNDLDGINKKINAGDYFKNASNSNIEIIRVSYINSHILSQYNPLLNLIMSYEDNDFFSSYQQQGLEAQAIFEKIINEKLGELTLVLFHGQLLGHSLSINLLTVNDDLPWLSTISNGHHHLIISLKSSNIISISNYQTKSEA